MYPSTIGSSNIQYILSDKICFPEFNVYYFKLE